MSTVVPVAARGRVRAGEAPPAGLGALFDRGSERVFAGATDGTGACAARARVRGWPVVGYVTGTGPLDERDCLTIAGAVRTAARERVPLVGVWRYACTAVAEGTAGLAALAAVQDELARASGEVVQLAVVTGPVTGDAAALLGLADLVVMSEPARVYLHGPRAVATVTGTDVGPRALGGPAAHARRSGLAAVVADGPAAAVRRARSLLALFADAAYRVDAHVASGDGDGHSDGDSAPPTSVARWNAASAARRTGSAQPDPVDPPDPGALLPERENRAYDVRPLVRRLLDGPGTEVWPSYAPNVVTVLGRLDAMPVGVVANNPIRFGGCLDAAAADKAAGFVRTCDTFGVPLLVLVDVPGYLPGVRQEWDGVVRRGAKLLHAFADAVVPRVTVVTRKAYGGAYIAMNSRALGATAVYAWPSARLGVMGAHGAVGIVHRRELAACAGDERAALQDRLAAAWDAAQDEVARAVRTGSVDAVVAPGETRKVVAAALRTAPRRRGRRRNVAP